MIAAVAFLLGVFVGIVGTGVWVTCADLLRIHRQGS